MKDEYARLVDLTRARLGYVWKMGLAGAAREGENAVAIAALEQHPEMEAADGHQT